MVVVACTATILVWDALQFCGSATGDGIFKENWSYQGARGKLRRDAWDERNKVGRGEKRVIFPRGLFIVTHLQGSHPITASFVYGSRRWKK